MFTLLINLGGEGIGTIAFLEALEQQGTHVQVVLVGGMREQEKREFKELAGRCRAVRVHAAGFVDNIYEYLYACDIVVGKAGINAMLEAIYLRRPFLVTTVYYTVKRRRFIHHAWMVLRYVKTQVDHLTVSLIQRNRTNGEGVLNGSCRFGWVTSPVIDRDGGQVNRVVSCQLLVDFAYGRASLGTLVTPA